MDDPGPALFFVVRFGGGHGVGHAVRCLKMTGRLRRAGRRVLVSPMGGDFDQFRELAAVHGGEEGLAVPLSSLSSLPRREGEESTLVITDLRSTSGSELELLSGLGVIVGLDEGGPFRGGFPYLIDMLPGFPPVPGKRNNAANTANVRLSPVLAQESGEQSVSWNNGGGVPSILLSFGGEDPASLTRLTASLLVDEQFCPAESILAVRGPLDRKELLPVGIAEAEGVKSLTPYLHHADLVITSFGLTACEAAACGTPVLLCNPSRYHEKLSSANGFSSIGVHRGALAGSSGSSGSSRRKALSALRRFFPEGRISPKELDLLDKPRCGSGQEEDPLSLLKAFRPENSGSCPLCGSRWNAAGDHILFRSRDRTVRKCGKCGTAVLFDPFPPGNRYGSEYFFSDYRAQYGRDYLEDFDHILGISRPRVERIALLLGGGEGKRLLDIGCAYGPFLAAAAEAGFSCGGVEPSQEAASYVRERFGFHVAAVSLQAYLDTSPEGGEEGEYDAITLWFVLEHLPEIYRLLPLLRKKLKTGGVLAFSTPSYGGISGRRNPSAFFKASPADHLSIMEPKQAARLVTSHGFRLASIVSTGIHPERFGFPYSLFSENIINSIAARTLLGDTFELYAVKA